MRSTIRKVGDPDLLESLSEVLDELDEALSKLKSWRSEDLQAALQHYDELEETFPANTVVKVAK